MDKRERSTLLIDAPVGRHFAQLHHDSRDRVDSIVQFVESGLRRGQGVVMIAVDEDHLRLTSRLERAGIDVSRAVGRTQLTILDSRATLNEIMRGPLPDWTRFRDTIGDVLERVQVAGMTRAYGDMVSVLWRDGQSQAAILLEEFWHELARLYPFSLFCSYTLDGESETCYADPLHEIGRLHTDIITGDRDDDVRDALDHAMRDVFGISLLDALVEEGEVGSANLPLAHRAMLWVVRNRPAARGQVRSVMNGHLRKLQVN